MESINARKRFPFDVLRFRDVDGIPELVLAIAQDFKTKEVLMVAYTNREAIEKTLETGRMHYFSTSKRKLWMKGERSGNVQLVREIYIDCDGDALLFKIEQTGGACHRGYKSCFYRKVEGDETRIVGEKIFNPDEVY
jgi:phosphoribosyl-AMP cyclohydrolase